MPRFSPKALREIGYQLFQAAGCRPGDAQAVVDHLVESSLFGHDSHGAIRFYEYAQGIRDGRFNPGARPSIVRERPSSAVVDGGGALGQVGAAFATALAMYKAQIHGVATVTLRNTSHIGRVGAYPLMAARAGFMAQLFANAGHLGAQVIPFGGREGRLSTNPMAFAAPRRRHEPLLLDMTTSVVAEGKVRVAINRGESIPEGWAVDAQGRPTADPRKVKSDPPGALLPLGGVVAHKGYGLSMMVEVMGGAMGGEGCAAGAPKFVSNGVLLTVYNIEHFTDLETYYDELDAMIAHIRTSRLAPGFQEILLPGEPEFRTARKREKEGIEVDDETWGQIRRQMEHFGVRET